MVIIIKRPDNADSGRRPHVTLAYERSGHTYVRRLTLAQDAFVLNLSMINNPPMQILEALKKEQPNTKPTLKHIYNSRLKHRVVEHKG
ncbi:hypothetical protein ACS0TY_030364 [Phlomoides rotata]